MIKKIELNNMIETFSEFKENKNVDKTTLITVLEGAFRSVIGKMFGSDKNYHIIVNPDKGDFEIWRNREVVADDKIIDPNIQITLSEAKKIDIDYEIGEEITNAVDFSVFGRRAVLNIRQAITSKILEIQNDSLCRKYQEKIGQIVYGEVYQIWKKEILLLDDEGNELILPKSEQIPSDFFHKNESYRAVVIKVESTINNHPNIVISRTSVLFMQRLFELEVPEIQDGLITIKKIVRIPGERAKIAVESYDERVDPVGACVGIKGSRIRGIVRELGNENIDVIQYTANFALFIRRSLSPAKISSIKIFEEERKVEIMLLPEEISLAIGKGGLNIKLASMLTEYTLDVFRESKDEEEDIYLDEFSDEIETRVIELLKSIGCYTAKSVLKKNKKELIIETHLEEYVVDKILKIFKAEFEDE